MIFKKLNKDFKDILKGSFVSFVFQIIGIGLSYLFIYLISNFYGAKAMGIYALMLTILNIVVLFSKFGLDLSMVKFVGELSEKKNISFIKDIYLKVLNLVIPISLILSIFLFFSAENIASFVFHKPYLKEYIKIIAFGVLPMTLRTINNSSLRGLQEIKKYAFLQNISLYLFSIIILLFFISFKEKEDIMPIFSILFGMYISMFLSIYLWINSSKIQKFTKNFYISYKDILKVSVPLLLTGSIILVYSMSDIIMLGMFRSEKEVGIYNVDYKIASAGMIFSMALTSILAPKIAASYKEKNLKRIKENIIFVLKILFFLSFLSYSLIFVLSKEILSFFGKDFVIGNYSLKLLIVAFFIKSVFGILGYVLEMTHFQKILIIFSLISAGINVLLNYLLIPHYGINGAVIASLISVIVHHSFLFFKVKQFLLKEDF